MTQPHRTARLPCPILAVTAALLLGSAQPRAQTGAAGGADIALPEIDVSGTPGAASARPGYLAPATSTATRTDTAIRDVPQSVTATTQQAIRDLSLQSIADVLRYTPGAGAAQGEGNRDTPVLRGQATTASLFVDGLRDDVQYYRDLYNVDRVEVLLGPNAMIFGRGGAGGVVNRVTRQADWTQVREVRLEAGSFNNFRGSFDVGQAISENFAARLMGFFQDSDSYRDDVHLRRYGINPTVSFRAGDATRVRVSFEHARDERTADRGIPSFGGRPLRTGTSTFFGDPARSTSDSTVNAVNVFAEHRFGNGLLLRNHFRFADYDKFYRNVFPGAVNAAGTAVAINAYSNATQRQNLINQTDLLLNFRTGPIEHRLLAGVELSRQYTENRRLTGYFGGPASNVTSVQVGLVSPRVTSPIFFRPSATDADNSGTATGAALLLQDQIRLLPSLQLIAGLRIERFEVDFRNRRTGEELKVTDTAVSPRIGLVWRPVEPLSLYASYSNSYLPRAGEQLASLTLNTRNLQPERFTNYEVGAKWDVLPGLALTAALFQIDRTNVAVTDPADVSRSVLVDGTRQRGFELGVRGRVTDRWSVLGGWAFQEGEVSSRQSATVLKGNTVPFLSRNAVSLWNRVEVTPTVGVGVGVIHQSSYFAATDNLVRIPGFTRLDAALFWRATDRVGVQANFENLLGTKYYPEAHSNNNITPGSPFAMRFALTANF